MKSLPWFRMYSEARTDNKLRTLADDEHRVWFGLLCMAAEQGERGTIANSEPFLLAVEIAGGDEELMERTIGKLVRLRILRREDDGTLAFINFGSRNHDKPSDLPEATRERKARQRARERKETDRHAPVTHESRDVTPNHAQEEIRVEEKRTLTPSVVSPSGDDDAAGAAADAETPKVRSIPKPKETPIPDDFAVTDQMAAFAANLGLSPPVVAFETEKFVDHFGSKKSERKSDWVAAWRNWMRRVGEFQPASPRPKATNGSRASPPPASVVSKGQGDRQRQIIGRD